MSEIAYLDGPILKPFFKLLHKSGLNVPIVWVSSKVLEIMGNGFSLKGYYNMGRFNWKRFKKIILIGQSHLDAAWRWRTKQGIIKARATIKKALQHIEEIPGFTFAQPSPQYYQWMKTYFPSLYSRLKEAVQKGRFIPIGGSWVECDTNLPNGESLIRQRLYGQRFYLSEFGFMADFEFLQDCFGFNWNLPQIYKKSGAKMFGTGKLFWNQNTKIPIGMCHWEAPDGTRLPMVHIHFGYFIPLNYGKEYPLIYLLGKKGKTLIANYETTQKEYAEWRSREYMLETVFGYGLGDGGHGPIEAEIAIVKGLKTLYPKIFKYYQKGDFYAFFKPYFDRWAIWRDEWYLDLHRGTYTSVSRIKRGNRDTENWMELLEKYNALMSLFGLSISRKEFETYWKIVLYNQFHDILPGSSIPEVYLDYDKDLKKVSNFYKETLLFFESFILQNIETKDEYGTPFVIFNPLSWEREDLIAINIGAEERGVIRDSEGKPLPTSIVPFSWRSLENEPDSFLAIAKIPSLPPLSYSLFYFDHQSQETVGEVSDKNDAEGAVKYQEDRSSIILENSYLTVKINKITGLVESVFSKTLQEEVMAGEGFKILVFDEKGKSDAWNIRPDYEDHPVAYDLKECEVEIEETTPLLVTVKIKRKIESSIFIQRYHLNCSDPFLHIAFEIDMKDPFRLVKLDIPLTLSSEYVSAEIPYAYIDRRVSPKTLLDRARWEHSCQKFVSLYDKEKDLGVSLFNNGKYGYNVKEETYNNKKVLLLRPTLLRTPHYTGYAKETLFVNRAPDGGLDPTMPKNTDLELHKDIRFGFYVHKGDWRKDAFQYAYNLNFPLLRSYSLFSPKENKSYPFVHRIINNHGSSMPASLSLLKLSHSNVQCGTIKFHEDADPLDNKTLIIRLVEKAGLKTSLILQFADIIKVHSAEFVDLLEFPLKDSPKQPVLLDDKRVQVEISPYEIMTLKVLLK